MKRYVFTIRRKVETIIKLFYSIKLIRRFQRKTHVVRQRSEKNEAYFEAAVRGKGRFEENLQGLLRQSLLRKLPRYCSNNVLWKSGLLSN